MASRTTSLRDIQFMRQSIREGTCVPIYDTAQLAKAAAGILSGGRRKLHRIVGCNSDVGHLTKRVEGRLEFRTRVQSRVLRLAGDIFVVLQRLLHLLRIWYAVRSVDFRRQREISLPVVVEVRRELSR